MEDVFIFISVHLYLTRQERLRTKFLFTTAAWQRAEPLEGESAKHVSLKRSMIEALKEMKESSLSFL